MVDNPTTKPLHQNSLSSHLPAFMNWRQKGVSIARIMFGFMWGIAAVLKWQPQFQNTFVDQVSAAKDGQSAAIQAWISFWSSLVTTNPLLFARIEATTESVLAVFLILGVFSNLTYLVGIFLSLGIWSVAEGFGGPYVPGLSTDIGAGFPYALLFAVLLLLTAGRYYGLDQWLTPRLGRLAFLASGTFKSNRK